jgi:hypothetical protein
MDSVCVEVCICLVIVVIESTPGVMIDSTRVKGWPSFTIFHLGILSICGEVHENLIPSWVCSFRVMAEGLI